MSRGWEDFWGRVRRVQYPTVIGAKQEATPYTTGGPYTHRTYERDTEFNILTSFLQARITWTVQGHQLVSNASSNILGQFLIYWDNVLKYTSGWWLVCSFGTGDLACSTNGGIGDVKVGVLLGGEFMRGKFKIEFQIQTTSSPNSEARITSDLCIVEVGPYRW